MPQITSKTFDEINLGDATSLTRILRKHDIQLFALVTGDMNPAHLDEKYSKTDIFHQLVGHGMWTGSMFSALLGMQLPGPGTIYLSQTLKFLNPVMIGDVVTATVKVTAKNPKNKHITLSTHCVNSSGKVIVEGEAVVLASKTPASFDLSKMAIPNIDYHNKYFDILLLERAKGLEPLKTAVVHPVDANSFAATIDAMKLGIIDPILIGPEAKLKAVAAALNVDINTLKLHFTPHSDAAAAAAVALVHSGEVEAIMKGKIATEELMHPMMDKETGLRTGRRMSHIFAFNVPSYPKPLFLTDAAINIHPTLSDKKDIVQNAVDLFHAIGLGKPYVAVLSAVETVTETLPSTLDATALCKMADRNQITGCFIDGPLAFDNAISVESANLKNIHSEVAGRADILVVPDLESGNMLYKQLGYFSGAQGAGIVLGAKVPIILTSRSSSVESRVSSAALSLLYTRASCV